MFGCKVKPTTEKISILDERLRKQCGLFKIHYILDDNHGRHAGKDPNITSPHIRHIF